MNEEMREKGVELSISEQLFNKIKMVAQESNEEINHFADRVLQELIQAEK